MGVPNLEVGYTSATTGRGDHEVHKGHVVALEGKKNFMKILGALLECYMQTYGQAEQETYMMKVIGSLLQFFFAH
jgi:hypothetical protein